MQQRPVKAREQKRGIATIAVGAAMVLLGPMLGLAANIWFVGSAFREIGAVDPSRKARVLAEGIASAQTFLVIGLGVGALGAVVLIAGIVGLLKRRGRTEDPDEPSEGPPSL